MLVPVTEEQTKQASDTFLCVYTLETEITALTCRWVNNVIMFRSEDDEGDTAWSRLYKSTNVSMQFYIEDEG